MFLHPAQCGRRGRVTGQNHQIAPVIKENLHRLGRAPKDIIYIAHPIGRMFVIAKIDDVQIRHLFADGVINRQPTQTAIKNSDCHG